MSQYPFVSVIVPTYNRGALLERAVKSILAQDYPEMEIIVVDDNSSDNTAEIMGRFKDPRIRFLRSDRNRGGSASRNMGILAAQGDFLALHDDDDEWLPNKLLSQMKLFQSCDERVGVVYTGFWRIVNNVKGYIPNPRQLPREGNIFAPILRGRYIVGTPTVVIRRNVFEEVGLFDEELAVVHDWDLWIRIARQYEFRLVDRPLVNSYYTPESLSTRRPQYIQSYLHILKKHEEDFRKDPIARSLLNIVLANQFCHIGNGREGRRCFRKAIQSHPLEMRAWLGGFASFLGCPTYRTLVAFKKLLKGEAL